MLKAPRLTLDQIRAFLEGALPLEFQVPSRQAAYDWIAQELRRFGYGRLPKKHKGLVRRYLETVTGFSRSQMTRLIRQFRTTTCIRDRRGPPAKPFPRRYTWADIHLLAYVDAIHGTLSGPATRKICERAYRVFGDRRFERLACISNGHLYNLRRSTPYRNERGHVEKTRPSKVSIGERRRPRPEGRPGFVRVDSVHQGDQDGAKGLFHINLVDEVTQFQWVGTVEALSERFLLPVLQTLLESFPFVVLGVHADNGSEFINRRVAKLLEKLRVEQFTKSRARRTNDNALVESKNGSVLRKCLGHGHIPRRHAERVNAFTQGILSPYLNFHRPCHFPTESVDAKGRVRKRYRYEDMMTPYEKLKSLPNAADYLKPGVTFEELDAIAYQMSDNEAAERLTEARSKLFDTLMPPRTRGV